MAIAVTAATGQLGFHFVKALIQLNIGHARSPRQS